jgi:hypothetical protein
MKTRDEDSLNKEKSRSEAELTLRKQHALGPHLDATWVGPRMTLQKSALGSKQPHYPSSPHPPFILLDWLKVSVLGLLALEQLHS